MVPVAAPARRFTLRRAALPDAAARAAPPTQVPLGAALLALLLPACSIGLPEGDVLAEAALPVAPLTIVDQDVVYTDADDEDLLVPGLQVTVRVDVADEGIERVAMHNDADQMDLSEPVRDDLDGKRVALFLVTLPLLENPVRAVALEQPVEARAVVRAVRGESPGQ